jgi:hypothetical protein
MHGLHILRELVDMLADGMVEQIGLVGQQLYTAGGLRRREFEIGDLLCDDLLRVGRRVV